MNRLQASSKFCGLGPLDGATAQVYGRTPYARCFRPVVSIGTVLFSELIGNVNFHAVPQTYRIRNYVLTCHSSGSVAHLILRLAFLESALR